eukprot:CAMPEP_0170538328 /NCGR_PEP_ID=MMETSP0209-20121228/103242_1 /TAXON_ID=665100 ORGANISM="Litonotus pictus, Strain P1" /NCGR_SAMPLE_ID=MMETSP0209 /ASSEMBLY_ACC=CAM_ASM_000301 /LENGTH=201 /DNA_ID=CAMNT_0010839989 /DNA_START=437 /DNA_END=1039 /DNA_ORIENTATION=-
MKQKIYGNIGGKGAYKDQSIINSNANIKSPQNIEINNHIIKENKEEISINNQMINASHDRSSFPALKKEVPLSIINSNVLNLNNPNNNTPENMLREDKKKAHLNNVIENENIEKEEKKEEEYLEDQEGGNSRKMSRAPYYRQFSNLNDIDIIKMKIGRDSFQQTLQSIPKGNESLTAFTFSSVCCYDKDQKTAYNGITNLI